jgi:dinuclear metal center YbgI/SA1388 family protein
MANSLTRRGGFIVVALQSLVDYCDWLLDVGQFRDYCPNGLQVEGRAEVARVVSGVTASQAMIDAAIEHGADLLLVHHGYFWKGEDPTLTGIKRRRVRTLLAQDISLLAYHLPLDAHPELGNNARLAARLGWLTEGCFGTGDGLELACYGRPQKPLAVQEMAANLAAGLDRAPLLVGNGPATIETLGWCTGAAQSYLEAAARRGLDAFVSGEISEPSVHLAREYGIHYFAAGHHATERYGVQALGAHLAAHFGIQHIFVDIDNPV